MSLLDSFRANVKNIFVGSHRGDDFIIENLTKKKEMPSNANDLGVDPNDWFNDKPHPHDSMPVATNKKSFDWEDTAPSEYEPPDPEEEDITMHEKMYKIATANYNPFAVGGSESIHDFDSIGGSEEAHK
tara:strand:- start:276 stop:662 length:387 start_codon:yes stop_codon:yes gene_type:complete